MHLIFVDVGVGAKVIKVYLCYDIIIFSFNLDNCTLVNYYGLIFNICSGVLFLLGLIFSYCTIIAKQIFTDKEGNKIKRLIYDK